jgi:excisionase family DNA binding protein
MPRTRSIAFRQHQVIDRRECLGAAEVAQLLGRSERTVRRWISKKVLRSVKIGGSRFVARSELEQLLRPDVFKPPESDD